MKIHDTFVALVSFAAAAVGFGAAALLLPRDQIGYAFVPAGAALILTYWYIEFYRPGLQAEKLRHEILNLAGSATDSLTFDNGSKDHFLPKGAFWLENRSMAMGLDPVHQLARVVFVLSQKLNTDWVYGLEILVQMEVLEGPRHGIGNRIRRALGLRLKTAMMLRQTDVNGQSVDLPLHRPHIDKARGLVRQVNFHRSRPQSNAS
jgi:hypothetical protein